MKHAGQIDGDDAVPGGDVEVEKIAAMADPGAFDQYVEPAEFADASGNRCIDRGAIAHIERLRDSTTAGGADAGGNRLDRAGIDVGEEDRRALARQPRRRGAANAAAGT